MPPFLFPVGRRLVERVRCSGSGIGGSSSINAICRAQVQIRNKCSFIGLAQQAKSASALLGPFTSVGRFDKCLEDAGLNCIEIGPEAVICELVVSEQLANNFGTLHGGALATLVDVVGTMALLGRDPLRPGVSVEMNQSFCSAAHIGDRLSIRGSVLRYGRTLGFTQVEASLAAKKAEPERESAWASETPTAGRLVALGRHTKMFPAVGPGSLA